MNYLVFTVLLFCVFIRYDLAKVVKRLKNFKGFLMVYLPDNGRVSLHSVIFRQFH